MLEVLTFRETRNPDTGLGLQNSCAPIVLSIVNFVRHQFAACVRYDAGNSVCCNVHGFEPYFYISCLDNFELDDIPKFRSTLEVRNLICLSG